MTMETKQEIFERYKKEYFKARSKKRGGRKRCGEILNIVCDVSKMHRKAAIRKFSTIQTDDPSKVENRGRTLYYTPDVTAALKDIWDASNGLCGELLHPLIKEYFNILERDKLWKHSDEATGKLLAMSAGSVKERVSHFMRVKRKGRGFSSTSPSQLKHIIPIFHGDWRINHQAPDK